MNEALVPIPDKDIVQFIHDTTKARALEAHPAIMDRLITILHGEDDKTALTAAGILLKLGGSLKAPRPIQVSFEELRKAAATVPAGPLGGITQITESAVIEGDFDDGDSDTE